MSKLDNAVDRFVRALDRLEQAIARKGDARSSSGPDSEELDALRADRGKLEEELDAVKADFAALESVADEVEHRLDSAIRDIQRVLNA